MTRDIEKLVDQLAAYVAAQLELNYDSVPEGERRQLFTRTLDRTEAADTASVIRLAGGPPEGYAPTVSVTVQCLTQGPTPAEAEVQAWAVHDVFYTDAGLPVRNLDLTDWRLLKIDAMQKPSPLGLLPGGGADVSFNWDILAVWIGD